VPDWFLYRSSTTTRLILDMGTTLRVSVLEKGASLLETLAFDAAPGMDILDELMRRLSGGRIPFDPSGHYAVQGRVCEPLVQQWLSHPFFVRTRPGLIDDATFSDSWFESSLTLASEHRLSAKDVLCSATHFLARSLVEGIRRHLPARLTLEEVIGGGGGLRNGFLVRLLEDRLGGIPLVRSDDVGLPAELTPAIQSAVFAYLALENLPGNLPSATGALSERVLGLLIPGSQGNWDRWVCGVADRFEWETRRAA
jgi:anhydro-N-acetylmuramic acid kinase